MDEIILRRAQKGDARAFEELIGPYEQMVWRVCWHYVPHRENALDCAQEAMLKAWRAIKSYRGECSLSSWLYRIASTVCLDFLRKQKRLPQTESADELAEEGFSPVDESPTPDEAILKAESADSIRAAIDSLPGDMRTVIILYALQGLPYEEIADTMNTSVGTVKSRISRARQKIAKYLTDGNNPLQSASTKVKGGRIHA